MENIVTQEILELIEQKKFGAVKQIIINMNGVDLAILFEELPPEI